MKINIRNSKAKPLLYSTYSFINNTLWSIFDLTPQFIRNIIFKLLLKRFGNKSTIDYKCFLRYPWRVSIGDNVSINRGCELYPSLLSDQGMILIDDFAVLGPKVIIFAAGHDYSKLDLPDTSLPVIIGRHAWIGGNTTILAGVVIGAGAVIGAGSVVTRSIPPYTIAVGNPAKIIKSRTIRNDN